MVELQGGQTLRVPWRQDRAGPSPAVVNTRPALDCTLLPHLSSYGMGFSGHSQQARSGCDSLECFLVLRGQTAESSSLQLGHTAQCAACPQSPCGSLISVPQVHTLPWPSPKHAVYPGPMCPSLHNIVHPQPPVVPTVSQGQMLIFGLCNPESCGVHHDAQHQLLGSKAQEYSCLWNY